MNIETFFLNVISFIFYISYYQHLSTIYQHVFTRSLHQPARQAKRYVELVLIARGASKAVEDHGKFGQRVELTRIQVREII